MIFCSTWIVLYLQPVCLWGMCCVSRSGFSSLSADRQLLWAAQTQSVSEQHIMLRLWVFFLLPDSLPFWACLLHFVTSELMPEAQSSRISVSFRKYIKAIFIVSKLSVFPSATPALAPDVKTLTLFSAVLQRMVCCCCFLLTAVSRYH